MNSSKIKILIANSDHDDAELWVTCLKEIIPNFDIIRATDGVQCLRYLKTISSPDLVFLDLNLPLKNGIECLRDIRNEELLKDTPIIVYASSKNIRDIDAAYKFGARFYLVKPDTFGKFIKLLKSVFTLLGESVRKQLDKTNFVIRLIE